MKHLAKVVALFVACGSIRAAVPEFELSSGTTGGHLTWHSHTFTPDGDFLIPKEDYVIEIPEQGVVSICLRWMTDPARVTGEFLDARGAWRIPKAALTAPRYVITVERKSDEQIVFTLAEPGGAVIERSPPFQILKGWYGDVKDIEKHVSIITSEDLKKTDQAEPNKPVDPTPVPARRNSESHPED